MVSIVARECSNHSSLSWQTFFGLMGLLSHVHHIWLQIVVTFCLKATCPVWVPIYDHLTKPTEYYTKHDYIDRAEKYSNFPEPNSISFQVSND